MPEYDGPVMDELDTAWVNSFIGSSIPEGSVVTGFVSVIEWIDPGGNARWRAYNTIDSPLSHILGLMTMAQFQLMHMNTNREED